MNKLPAMKIRDAAHIALANFKKHKTRTALSCLGIIIGILAVSLIISLGQGVKAFILSEMSAFGTNIIDITTKVPGRGSFGTVASMVQGITVTTLKEADLEAISIFDFFKRQAGFAIGQVWTRYQNKENQVLLFCTGPDYVYIDQQTKLEKGRFFNSRENQGAAKVIVLGSEAKSKLFGEKEAVGKIVKIKNHSFKVVGVLQKRGQTMGVNFDDMVIVPLKTGQKILLGIDYIIEGVVQVKEGTDMKQAVQQIEALLRRRHKITDPEKDDFQVMSMEEALEIAETVTDSLNILLIFLASISLLTGGIGIMNVMLVSLSERIREIGLRKAFGATDKAVFRQFLVEAILLTSFGGFVGIFLAFLITLIGSITAAQMGAKWSLASPLWGFLLAFFTSVLVGLVFGLYPAKKAARLDPIQAIRHE